MANPLNQKQLQTDSVNGFPVGSCTQSPVNLETSTGGQWVLLDGRDADRSAYPQISAFFVGGVSTPTARTLNATPVSASIAADATNFLMPGAAGTSPLQASPDSITWSTSATWTAATSPACIIAAGTRFVMCGSGGDLVAPYVSNINQAAAAQVAKANWTATTGGTTSTLANALAYSPTLAMTVMVPSAAGTSIFTLADGATVWTTQTATSRTKYGVCWTGQKFIVPTNAVGGIQTSTNGTAWTESSVLHSSTTLSNICSDGAGTVVATATEPISGIYIFVVSKDHGGTWRKIQIPSAQGAASSIAGMNYINGRFVAAITASTTGCSAYSSDGYTWAIDPLSYRIGLTPPVASVYKSGVYCGWISATSAISWTEDMSKFTFPGQPIPWPQTAVGYIPVQIPYYMRAY